MTSTDSPISVRPARQDDLAAITEFIHPFVVEGRLLPRTETELVELLDTGFVAERAGKVVGFSALEIYSAKLAEIRSLAVSGDVQGGGVGRKLIAACIELAREKRVLEVMAITSSEQFFLACGFDFTLPGEKKAFFLQTRDV